MGIEFAGYCVRLLETAVRSGRSAPRGPLSDALQTLNVFSAHELGCRSDTDDMPREGSVADVAEAIGESLSSGDFSTFRFEKTLREGRAQYGDPRVLMDHVEPLVAELARNVNGLLEAGPAKPSLMGSLARKLGGGDAPCPPVVDLLVFAEESLSLAGYAFGEGSTYPDLEVRIVDALELLPTSAKAYERLGVPGHRSNTA